MLSPSGGTTLRALRGVQVGFFFPFHVSFSPGKELEVGIQTIFSKKGAKVAPSLPVTSPEDQSLHDGRLPFAEIEIIASGGEPIKLFGIIF